MKKNTQLGIVNTDEFTKKFGDIPEKSERNKYPRGILWHVIYWLNWADQLALLGIENTFNIELYYFFAFGFISCGKIDTVLITRDFKWINILYLDAY